MDRLLGNVEGADLQTWSFGIQRVSQHDQWKMWSGVVHHKSRRQNMCLTHSWPQLRSLLKRWARYRKLTCFKNFSPLLTWTQNVTMYCVLFSLCYCIVEYSTWVVYEGPYKLVFLTFFFDPPILLGMIPKVVIRCQKLFTNGLTQKYHRRTFDTILDYFEPFPKVKKNGQKKPVCSVPHILLTCYDFYFEILCM